MADISWRSLPSIYPLRSFSELNLRAYVTHKGKAGVWFFSLDADCRPIVFGGRRFYGLPYFRAAIDYAIGTTSHFKSVRSGKPVQFEASFRPVTAPLRTSAGSFEEWLTERYCFFSSGRGSLWRVDVHHQKWSLQKAEMMVHKNGLFSAAKLIPHTNTPICHYSAGVDVISFPAVRLE
jgi:uncharacterized protein YqjF (DUF2071 family)